MLTLICQNMDTKQVMSTCILLLLCLSSGVLSKADEVTFTTEAAEPNSTIPVTDANSTAYCDREHKVNISETHRQLTELKNDLDVLLIETLETSSMFILKHNKMFGQIALNVTRKYLNYSRIFLDEAKELNSTILCSGIEKYGKYKIDFIEEYEQKLEITQSFLLQLENVTECESGLLEGDREDATLHDQFVIENTITQIKELLNIIDVSSEIGKLNALVSDHYKVYWYTDDISSLGKIISLTKQILPLYYQILEQIDDLINSSSGSDVRDIVKSNVTAKLINATYWKEKLEGREKFLKTSEERYAEDMSLLMLKDVVRPTVLGILFFVGLIGNGLLLIVFLRHKDMRILPNLMVINLTIADFLCLIVNVPFYILETLTNWTYGDVLCKCYRFSRFLTIGLSVYSVVVISIQRCFALTGIKKSRRFRCGMKPFVMIILVWGLAGAFASLRAIKAFHDKRSNTCVSGKPGDKEVFFKPLTLGDLVIYCIVPLLVVVISSGMTSKELKKSVKNMPGEAIGRERVVKARVLSSNILLALTVVFAISYTPYFSYIAYDNWFTLKIPFVEGKYLSFFLYALIFSNACFNPIALYLVSHRYRRYMNNYLFCRKKTHKRKISTETNTTTVETKM